jgi:hypothetical protein
VLNLLNLALVGHIRGLVNLPRAWACSPPDFDNFEGRLHAVKKRPALLYGNLEHFS